MKNYWLLLYLMTLTAVSNAQLFNPFVEANLKLCQVDGDRLTGYEKLGFDFGVGMNTRIYKALTFDVYAGYSSYGSMKEDVFTGRKPIDELELDISAASINFGPRIEVSNKVSFKVFFQYQVIFNIDYTLHSRKFGEEKYEIEEQNFENNNIDLGGKLYFKIYPKHFLYVGFQRGISNLLISPYPEFSALVPFSIDVGYRYSLYSSVMKKKKRRR